MVIDTDTDFNNGVITNTAALSAGASSSTFYSHILPPGTYNIYGFRSADWATNVTHNPFDMDDSDDDIHPIPSFTYNITGSFTGGNYVGTTTGTDPSFYLNIPTGYTIDTSLYRYPSVRINYTGGVGLGGETFTLHFFPTGGGAIISRSVATVAGVGVYDLPALPAGQTIIAVRVDPADGSGISFEIDWISISQNSTYEDSLSSPTTSSAPGTVTVQDLPLGIVQPDKRGGKDFAQVEMGKAWNMNAAQDIGLIYNVLSAVIYPFATLTDPAGVSQIGDFFSAENTPNNGDANYFSVLNNGEIDPSKYVFICFRAWNSIEQPSLYNSVARILWADPREGETVAQYKNGDDIIMNRGAQEYCVDMRTEIEIEPALPPGSPNPWTSIGDAGSKIKYFRIDLNENEESLAAHYTSVFDYIHLRTDHQANAQYAIVVDTSLGNTVNLYYNSTKARSGATAIGTLASGRNTNVYLWNTSAVTAGSYYVIAEIVSGGNTRTTLSEGRVQIDHTFTEDSTAPILNCERPAASSLFNNDIELAGYALDETRLAALEVFIDGTYFTSIKPSRFHLDARNAYPTYAESNNPGFQSIVSTSSIADGDRVVLFKATDTAGNQTTCSRAVRKEAGVVLSPLVYPTPDNSSIALSVETPEPTPTPTPIPTPVPAPRLAIKIAKNKVQFAISSVSTCSSVRLLASEKSNFSGPTTVSIYSGNKSKTLTAKAVPQLKKAKASSMLFFRASCNGETATANVKLDLRKLKSSKKVKAAKDILKFINSKI